MKFSPYLIAPLFVSGLFFNHAATADIKEISPEEMTESYIRDTTVIVPRAEPNQGGVKADIVISEIEAQPTTADTPQNKAGARPDLAPVSDNYLAEQWNRSQAVQNQPQYNQPLLDPSQAQRDEYLRTILGLEAGTPIDYSQLQFPTSVAPVTPPPGVAYDMKPGSFTISIPNTNNYAETSHQPVNGNYKVDVTPSDIIFTINLPQQR